MKLAILTTRTVSQRETNVQGLLLEEIQSAAPEAYEKRVKRLGVVNAFTDPNFAEAVRATGINTSFSPSFLVEHG